MGGFTMDIIIAMLLTILKIAVTAVEYLLFLGVLVAIVVLLGMIGVRIKSRI